LGELYVDDTAPGDNNGLNWTDAFLDLQDALAVALPGDEIWVATGIYTPGQTVSDSFALVPGVAIYGGFAATETLKTERDWNANLTILSGDIGGDDGKLGGVVTDTNFITGDNSYHVLTSTGVLSNTILDGFTITAGSATGSYAYPCASNCGGGMYNYGSSSPTLANLVFSGNAADGIGGGMSNATSSNPIISDVTFAGNSASRGGGMANTYSSHPSLASVTFIDNNADKGGGLYNFQSSPTLQDANFIDNFGATDGGGIYNLTNSNPVLFSAVFHQNNSNSLGGGISNDESSPVLTDVTFTGNSASSGGGMANIDNSNVHLTSVIFSGNTASQSGGGIYNSLSTNPIITDTIFILNTAGTKGGAISHVGGGNVLTLLHTTLHGNSANIGGGIYSEAILDLTNTIFVGNVAYENVRGPNGGEGGAIYSAGTYGTSNLFNTTIAHNQAFAGGALYSEDSTTINILNSILWGNQATLINEIFIADGSVGITNTIVTEGCPWGASTCTNVFDIDPQFEQNPDAGDGDWLTLGDNDYGDLRLTIPSPAVNAGENSYVSVSIDLDGNARIVNIVDLGAYEQAFGERIFFPIIIK
jgi:predicted outer membrane repeat protein